jgi:hypothetical protein
MEEWGNTKVSKSLKAKPRSAGIAYKKKVSRADEYAKEYAEKKTPSIRKIDKKKGAPQQLNILNFAFIAPDNLIKGNNSAFK